MTDSKSIPEPIEASVYRRLHDGRDTHIEERRRARQAQADVVDALEAAGQEFGRGFLVGWLSGVVGTALAIGALAVIVLG